MKLSMNIMPPILIPSLIDN